MAAFVPQLLLNTVQGRTLQIILLYCQESMDIISPEPYYSKCGLGTITISIIWELIRNSKSQASPHTY